MRRVTSGDGKEWHFDSRKYQVGEWYQSWRTEEWYIITAVEESEAIDEYGDVDRGWRHAMREATPEELAERERQQAKWEAPFPWVLLSRRDVQSPGIWGLRWRWLVVTDGRVSAVIERLLSNIPAVCEILEEEGSHNLAGQLRRDCEALRWWQERGGLGLGPDVAEASAGPKELDCEGCLFKELDAAGGWCYMFAEKPAGGCAKHREWVRPASSGAEWNLDVEGRVVDDTDTFG